MPSTPTASPVIAGFVDEFNRLKRSCEQALAQVADKDLYFRLNPQQNSIAVIIRHVAGNMRSRWTDFLTTDGEKPNRDRETEFVEKPLSRAELMRVWEDGWGYLFRAMGQLKDSDLAKTVTIRGEAMTAVTAIARQAAHYGWHVGQIMLLAKHLKGQGWKYVTIPPAQAASGS